MRGRGRWGHFVEGKVLENTREIVVASLGRPPIECPRMAKKSSKANSAFMKPVTPDEKLAAVVGATPLPRTELTKKLWVYIKKNGLQDKKNKRNINADPALKAVFNGKATVSMFEMTKLVSGHLK
jgi:chromatin remodeling complex protein RSC6